MQEEICQHKVALFFFVVSDGHKLLSVTLSFERQLNKQACLRGIHKKRRGRR